MIAVFEPGSIPKEAFIRQRCRRHLEDEAADVIAPTWERFDPIKHSDLIQSVPVVRWTAEGIRTDAPGRTAIARANRRTRADGAASLRELLIIAEESRVERPALTALYRYYDQDNRLLYVGITDTLLSRTMSHIEASSWMDFAARSTIERHPVRRDAEAAEVEAIKTESPLFNSRHNDTPEARKRLVEYLIEQGRTDLLAAAVSRG